MTGKRLTKPTPCQALRDKLERVTRELADAKRERDDAVKAYKGAVDEIRALEEELREETDRHAVEVAGRDHAHHEVLKWSQKLEAELLALKYPRETTP